MMRYEDVKVYTLFRNNMPPPYFMILDKTNDGVKVMYFGNDSKGGIEIDIEDALWDKEEFQIEFLDEVVDEDVLDKRDVFKVIFGEWQ